jgi:hypothetical protein
MAYHTTLCGRGTTEDGRPIELKQADKSYPFPSFKVIVGGSTMVGVVGPNGPFSWHARPLRHRRGFPGRVVHARRATGDYPTPMEAAKALVAEYAAARPARRQEEGPAS